MKSSDKTLWWILGGLAVGGAIWYATRPAKAAKKTPVQPDLVPVEPEGTGVPFTQIRVVQTTDTEGVADAAMESDDPMVDYNADRTRAWLVAGQLPVDVMVSVPASFTLTDVADPGSGVELIAGTPGTTRDLVFRVRQYAVGEEREDASILVGTSPGDGHYVPLFIFVVPE